MAAPDGVNCPRYHAAVELVASSYVAPTDPIEGGNKSIFNVR